MVEHVGSEKMAVGQKPLAERTYESKYIDRSLAQLNDVCFHPISFSRYESFMYARRI